MLSINGTFLFYNVVKIQKKNLRQASMKKTLGQPSSSVVNALFSISLISTSFPSGQDREVWSPWLLMKQIKLAESFFLEYQDTMSSICVLFWL